VHVIVANITHAFEHYCPCSLCRGTRGSVYTDSVYIVSACAPDATAMPPEILALRKAMARRPRITARLVSTDDVAQAVAVPAAPPRPDHARWPSMLKAFKR
jgi:hypothetical protein